MPAFIDPAVLPIVFAALMGVSILAYVILDGYDLGIGMLMARADRPERDRMIATIGPFWDANETWLVLGNGLLLVAFPTAHGMVLTALYLPVALMLARAHAAGRGLRIPGQGAGNSISAGGIGRSSPGSTYRLPDARLHARPLHHGVRRGLGRAGFALQLAHRPCRRHHVRRRDVPSPRRRGALQARAVCAGADQRSSSHLAGMIVVSIATPLVSARIFERWFAFPNIIGLMRSRS